MFEDHIDRLVAQWHRERPNLDVSPMEIIGRISRIARLTGSEIGNVHAQFGLTRESFDILSTLRRSGPPYEMSPTSLMRWLFFPSSTLTGRLDKLEMGGLIRRTPDPNDRRSLRIQLTELGGQIIDTAMDTDMALEKQLIAGLTLQQQTLLANILRQWLKDLESNSDSLT